MRLNTCDYQDRAREAVKSFWRSAAISDQERIDAGEAGQSSIASKLSPHEMEGFVTLMRQVVTANGLKDANIKLNHAIPALSGPFSAGKKWDMLVLHKNRLIAALNFTSQAGSYENAQSSRAQEALGIAHDFWTAFREGSLGEDTPRPFLGSLILAEDARDPTAAGSETTSYDRLCKKLVRENLYTASCLLLSERSAVRTGKYTELSELTDLETFVTGLASHVAAEAAKGK